MRRERVRHKAKNSSSCLQANHSYKLSSPRFYAHQKRSSAQISTALCGRVGTCGFGFLAAAAAAASGLTKTQRGECDLQLVVAAAPATQTLSHRCRRRRSAALLLFLWSIHVTAIHAQTRLLTCGRSPVCHYSLKMGKAGRSEQQALAATEIAHGPHPPSPTNNAPTTKQHSPP